MLYPIERIGDTSPLRRTNKLYLIAMRDSGASSQTDGDSIDVGHTAELLTAITEVADAIPVVDRPKVTGLQRALASGMLKANSDQIARSAVELDMLLWSATRS